MKWNTPEYRKVHYTGIYSSWYGMKQRCSNKNHRSYKDYGGRGITYDPYWESFANFQRDMQCGYKKGLTLDRIDTNDNYCKENCRWATRKEQNRNKRCNLLLENNGEIKTLLEWCKDLDLSYNTVRSRYYRDMPAYKILKPTLYRPQKL